MRVALVARGAAKALGASVRAAAPRRERENRLEASHRPDAAGRALLLSVKPRYAEAILDGSKTVELRRTRPNLPAGSLVILYSSTPTRAIVGWARLVKVCEGTPIEIWDDYGTVAGIEALDYDAYFNGTDQAFAIELDGVVAAGRPIPLSVLRSIGIQPPQSWRYLSGDVTAKIQAAALV